MENTVCSIEYDLIVEREREKERERESDRERQIETVRGRERQIETERNTKDSRNSKKSYPIAKKNLLRTPSFKTSAKMFGPLLPLYLEISNFGRSINHSWTSLIGILYLQGNFGIFL